MRPLVLPDVSGNLAKAAFVREGWERQNANVFDVSWLGFLQRGILCSKYQYPTSYYESVSQLRNNKRIELSSKQGYEQRIEEIW
jgi:hypothetical protein